MIPIYIGFTSLVQSRISHASRLFAQCRTNPVLVVCSGIPLCAWHSTGVPVWQSAADIRDCRSSMSPLCWHHDTTSAVDSLGYPWRLRLSGGCSACMEQSATRDSGLLLTFDIPEGDQVSPFSSVIRLTWRRLLRWSADVCIELCNSFISRFCKVPPQLCDGSTVVHGICSSRVQGPVCFLYSVIKLNCIWRLLFDAVKLVVDGLRDRFYCVT